MPSRLLAFLPACALALIACSGSDAGSWEPAAPPQADAEIAALIPSGSFDVSGTAVSASGPMVEIDGYVELRSAADPAGCQSEYTLTVLQPDGQTPVTEIEVVRPSGGPAFARDVTIAFEPGPWMDLSEPAHPDILFGFLPAMLTAGGSSGPLPDAGVLCALGLLPRLLTAADGRLAPDPEKVSAALDAAAGQWAREWVDALGLNGSFRSSMAETMAQRRSTASDPLLGPQVTVGIQAQRGGVFVITQSRSGETEVTVILTPADVRTVTRPDVPGFFPALADRAARESVEALIDEFLPPT